VAYEDEQDEDEEEDEEEDEDEEQISVFVHYIDGTKYYTDSIQDGSIYEFQNNGDCGDELGELKNGKAFFY